MLTRLSLEERGLRQNEASIIRLDTHRRSQFPSGARWERRYAFLVR
jgi:hypothetical protein